MDRKLCDYLPPVVQTMREMKAITDGEEESLAILWSAVENVCKDQFIEDATENGIKRWEKILAVATKGSETLDDRRFRIKARLNEQLPFTLPVLRNQLETLCGKDGYYVEIQRGSYLLYVKVALGDKNNSNDVRTLLQRVVPVHLVYNLVYELETASHFIPGIVSQIGKKITLKQVN